MLTYFRALDRICETAAKNSDIKELSQKFQALSVIGADINDQIVHDIKNNRIGLLEYAVLNNKEDLAVWLLNYGMAIESISNDRLLSVAAKCGGLKICTWLMEKGMSINVQDEKGKTAMHYANDIINVINDSNSLKSTDLTIKGHESNPVQSAVSSMNHKVGHNEVLKKQ